MPSNLLNKKYDVKIFFWLLAITFSQVIQAQELTLSGKIINTRSEPIMGATISTLSGKYWATSDDQGKWKLSLPNGVYHIDFSMIGYNTFHKDVSVDDNMREITIILQDKIESLDEVEIHADTDLRKQKESTLAIEVVNDTYIQKNLQGSLIKSLDELPGLSTISVGSGASKPIIRGLSFNRVSVIENGIKHEAQQWGEDHGLEIDPFTVKKVELVKGPQSLQYGSDGIGGSIIINNTTFPYEQGWKHFVLSRYESVNQSIGGGYNFIFRKNKFYTDTKFSYQNFADYKIPVDTVDIYNYKARLKDGKLRNTAGQNFNVYSQMGWLKPHHHTHIFLSYYQAKNAFFANAHGLEPLDVDEALHDASARDIQLPYQKAQHFKAMLNTTWYRDHRQWHLKAGYQKNYRQEKSIYINHGYMPANYPTDLDIPSHLERLFDKDVFHLNTDYEFKKHDFSYQMGLSAEMQINKINGWSFIIPAYKQQSYGAFVLGKYKLNKTQMLHAGMRYDFAILNTEHYADWFTSPTPDNGETHLERAGELSKKFNSTSFSLGWNYHKIPWELKSNLGKSFRIPTAKEIASNGVNYHRFSYEKGDENLQPEIAYQWDISLAYKQPEWAVQFTPFISYFTNYIYLNPTSEYDFLYGAGNQIFEYSSAEVLRWGGEIHAHWNLSDQLKTDLIAEHVHSTQQSGVKKGYGLPFAPPLQLINKLNYNPKNKKSHLSTSYTLTHVYNAAQNNVVPPEEKTPQSSIWHLQAEATFSIKATEWTCIARVNNLLNTTYFNHTDYYRIIGVPQSGRSLTVSLKLNF